MAWQCFCTSHLSTTFKTLSLHLLLIGTFITRTWSFCDYFKLQGHRGRDGRGGTRDRLRARESETKGGKNRQSHLEQMYCYLYIKVKSDDAFIAGPLHRSPRTSIHLITSVSNDLHIYDFKYYLSWILIMLRMGLSNLCFDYYIKTRSKCIKTGLVAPW